MRRRLERMRKITVVQRLAMSPCISCSVEVEEKNGSTCHVWPLRVTKVLGIIISFLVPPTPLTFGTARGICTSPSCLQAVMPWISWQTMSILEVFESLITEIRFESFPITTPTKRVNTMRAEVMEENQLISEGGDEKVDAHSSFLKIFVLIPFYIGRIGKKEGETRLTNIVI